jgi:dolichyl-phosphate beta-glucosyltransferase
MIEKDISIIIPTYNEANRIQQTVVAIDSYLKERFANYEIIVIDDGSLDSTFSILSNLCESYENLTVIKKMNNTGKGYSVREGILASNGKLTLFCDADLSTPIIEIEKLIPWINKGFDIAIGSRALSDSEIIVRQPWYRERMGKIFNILVRLFILKGFRDTQCGFKLFRSDVAKNIFKRSNIKGYSFDVEVLYIAKRLNYKIKEVPVRWSNSKDSKLSILKDPIIMIIELFKIKWSHKWAMDRRGEKSRF